VTGFGYYSRSGRACAGQVQEKLMGLQNKNCPTPRPSVRGRGVCWTTPDWYWALGLEPKNFIYRSNDLSIWPFSAKIRAWVGYSSPPKCVLHVLGAPAQNLRLSATASPKAVLPIMTAAVDKSARAVCEISSFSTGCGDARPNSVAAGPSTCSIVSNHDVCVMVFF
jgi:hypothetical protein